MSDLWVLTGKSGSGKTQFCIRTLQRARAAGWSVGGMYTCPFFYGSEKIGMMACSAEDDSKQILARRRDLPHPSILPPYITLGQWMFYTSALDWGNSLFLRATEADLLIVDELGWLEFLYRRGLTNALARLDEGAYRTALVVVRPALLPLALKRWRRAHILPVKKATPETIVPCLDPPPCPPVE